MVIMRSGLFDLQHMSYLLSKQNNWPSLASIGQFFYILLLIVTVALLAYYSTKLLASSKNMRRGRHNLEVIESVGVGMQAMVQIIRAGQKYLVIGVTKDRINFLAEIDETQLVQLDAANPSGMTFEKILQRFIDKDKNKDKE